MINWPYNEGRKMLKSQTKTKGLKVRERKLATTTDKSKLTANQWQSTPQQTKFMEQWLTPTSGTFGNAYRSAIAAGYKEHYALQLASPSVNNKWITEYAKKLNLTDEHIRQGIQSLALSANNAKSPDDTRLKAYEILAKISGMVDNRGGSTTNILVQPILGGASTKVVESVEHLDVTPDPVDSTVITH